MFELEKFAEGRYDVLAENGTRAGSILGGASNWTAEVGNRVVGRFPTQSDAAEAIMKDRGIKGIFDQMAAFIESGNLLHESHGDQFYKFDRNFVDHWKCATSFLWIVRRTGTNIIALDLPSTQREATAFTDAYRDDEGNYKVYLVDANALTVKAIDTPAAINLANQPPKFKVKDGCIASYGTTIASVTLTGAIGRQQFDRRCHVKIDCVDEPSKRILAVLQQLAFTAILESGKFSAPESIEIFYGKLRLYEWVQTFS